MLKAKIKPKDVTAKIKLKRELEKVKFQYANDYYKDIILVMARFDVSMMIEIMAKQVMSSTYESICDPSKSING